MLSINLEHIKIGHIATAIPRKTKSHRKGRREWETTGRGQRQLQINTNKKGKKQLIFVWPLAYKLSDLSGPTRNMNVSVDLACKNNETHKPPYHDNVLTTGEFLQTSPGVLHT